MRLLKKFTFVAAAVALAAAAAAFERNPGADAGAFSSWGLGARADALGRAYGALADDAAALYWNPAGLAALERTELTFGYGVPFREVGDVALGDAAVAKPLLYGAAEEAGGAGSLGTLAAALAFRSAGEIYEAGENGPTGRTFDNMDLELSLGYAHSLGEKAAFGLALKNVTREVGDYSDSGFGVDVGATYRPLPDLGLGAVARNVIAPNFRLKMIKDVPALTFELSGSYDAFGLAAPCASLEITREGFYDVGAGLEVTPVKYVALRGGYYTGDERLRAGLGFCFGVFRFDYTARLGGPLGDSHLASVSAFFAGEPPPSEFVIPEEEGYIEYEPAEEPAPEEESQPEEEEGEESPGGADVGGSSGETSEGP
jgi:hypothetical protein